MNETEPTITIEDLRRKAVHIRDMAEVETRAIAEEQATRIVLVGVIVVVAAVSIAYYLGSRRA